MRYLVISLKIIFIGEMYYFVDINSKVHLSYLFFEICENYRDTTFVGSVWKWKFKSEKIGSKENWTFAESNFFRPQKFSNMLWSFLLSPATSTIALNLYHKIFIIMIIPIFTAIKCNIIIILSTIEILSDQKFWPNQSS